MPFAGGSEPEPWVGDGSRTNRDIADRLDEVGRLMGEQNGNRFRVRAYRRAAGTLRRLPRPVEDLFAEGGIDALEALPDVGESLARSIAQFLVMGRLAMLDRLRGESEPGRLLQTVPGIGPVLAGRIHEELGVETLEELEMAAHDGRLEQVPGFGPRRARGVREALAGMLGRSARRRSLAWKSRSGAFDADRSSPSTMPGEADLDERPSVELLLEVDEEYRRKAEAGRLPRIAPRRFNPAGEAWLPILHTDREGWHLTALYSNTARAHDLGKTHDWVVIYADGARGGERRFTVVTEYRGELAGERVVRGREVECRTHYGRSPGSQGRG